MRDSTGRGRHGGTTTSLSLCKLDTNSLYAREFPAGRSAEILFYETKRERWLVTIERRRDFFTCARSRLNS